MDYGKAALVMSVVFLIVSLGGIIVVSSQISGLQSQISSQQSSIAQQNALIGLYANASGFSTGQAQKIAAAKAEGSVTVYSDQASGTDALVAAFEQTYGINVNFVHFGTSPNLISQFTSEESAGKNVADVVTSGATSAQIPSFYQWIANYTSPNAASIPYKLPSGFRNWAVESLNGLDWGYSTKLLNSTTAPTSWLQLNSTQWRGKIACRATSSPVITAVSTYVFLQFFHNNTQQWMNWMQGVGKNCGTFIASYTQLNQLISSGEYPLAFPIYPDYTTGFQQQGYNISWAHPKEGVLVEPLTIAVTKTAQHPHAAELYEDFMLSTTAQNIMGQQGWIPANSKVVPTWTQPYVSSGGQFVYNPQNDVLDGSNFTALQKTVNTAFGQTAP